MQATRHLCQAEADMEAESDTGSLPDRLINPVEYGPLLSTTEEHTTADPTEHKELVNEGTRRLTPVYTYGTLTNC